MYACMYVLTKAHSHAHTPKHTYTHIHTYIHTQEGSIEDMAGKYSGGMGTGGPEGVRGALGGRTDKTFAEQHASIFDDVDPLKFLSHDPKEQVCMSVYMYVL
jgi:hypothetical protein